MKKAIESIRELQGKTCGSCKHYELTCRGTNILEDHFGSE